MKQLTVISGKGGTGKTSITAALASLAEKIVVADCDVDAADLHLIMKPDVKKTIDFQGLKIAEVDKKSCIKCKKCFESCKFDAIDDEINIIKESCEGCSVCRFVCPVDAISMVDRDSGFAYISDTRFGPMSHAMLKTAEEASGKLVTLVRENAKSLAEKNNKELVIIDGPPGIGCPVVSAITGVDLVLIVTEPTLSAIHDLKRVIDVADHFKISSVICINKYDINVENSEDIEKFCKSKNIEVVGKIPYDTVFTKAMVDEKNIIEYDPDNDTSNLIKNMWNEINKKIMNL